MTNEKHPTDDSETDSKTMCYDTTLDETLDEVTEFPEDYPECLRRDRLQTEYFPQIGRSLLAGIIVLCGIYMVTSFNRLNHTDLWGHLNFGRWIAQHKMLPTTDPFALVASEKPLVNIPWLAQLGGYALHQQLGSEGLVLAHALLVTLACGLCMYAIRLRKVNMWWAVIGTVVMYLISIPTAGTIRPQLFGMVGVAATVLACSILPKKKHPLFWLPIVYVLWANFHGSFVIGLGILGIYAVSQTFQRCVDSHSIVKGIFQRDSVIAWAALAVATIAACVNPMGPMILVAVAQFGANPILGSIAEWRRLPMFSLSGIMFWSSVLATFAILKHSKAKLQPYEILMLVVFGIASISAIRMVAWWAIVWPWVIAPHAMSAWKVWREESGDGSFSSEEDEERSPMAVVQAIGFIFMALLIAPPSQAMLSAQPRKDGAVASTGTPIYMADEMTRIGAEGKFFAPMDWADYLVWSNPEKLTPLVYTHVHAVEPEVWKDYAKIATGDESWQKIARSRDLDYLVVSRRRQPALAKLVNIANFTDGSGIRVIYQDQKSMLVELLPEEKPAEESDA